jgi:hypothetical protein
MNKICPICKKEVVYSGYDSWRHLMRHTKLEIVEFIIRDGFWRTAKDGKKGIKK